MTSFRQEDDDDDDQNTYNGNSTQQQWCDNFTHVASIVSDPVDV